MPIFPLEFTDEDMEDLASFVASANKVAGESEMVSVSKAVRGAIGLAVELFAAFGDKPGSVLVTVTTDPKGFDDAEVKYVRVEDAEQPLFPCSVTDSAPCEPKTETETTTTPETEPPATTELTSSTEPRSITQMLNADLAAWRDSSAGSYVCGDDPDVDAPTSPVDDSEPEEHTTTPESDA